MNATQIKYMVERFLGWRLPNNFNPDAGISFKPNYNEHTSHPMKHEPVGTNLFGYNQAEEMVRYMLEGLPKHFPIAQGGTQDEAHTCDTPNYTDGPCYACAKDKVLEWVFERYENCVRLAEQKTGEDKRGWLDDADHFLFFLTLLKRTHASQSAAPGAVELPIGSWPKVCLQRAFVDGAAWWRFHKLDGFTLFPSEREEAEAEAIRKFGPVEGAAPGGGAREPFAQWLKRTWGDTLKENSTYVANLREAFEAGAAQSAPIKSKPELFAELARTLKAYGLKEGDAKMAIHLLRPECSPIAFEKEVPESHALPFWRTVERGREWVTECEGCGSTDRTHVCLAGESQKEEGSTPMKRTRDHKEWLLEKLRNIETAASYIAAAALDSPEMFLIAVHNVAQANPPAIPPADTKPETCPTMPAGDSKRRWMKLPPNPAYPHFSEVHLEDDWCKKAGCRPAIDAWHDAAPEEDRADTKPVKWLDPPDYEGRD